MALAWASIGHFVFLFGLHPQEKYLLSTDPQSETITMMTHRKSENHSLFYLYLDFCILVYQYCWDSAFGIIMIKGISHLSWRSSKVTLVKTNWTPHPTRPLWTKSPCFLFVNKIYETCLLFKTALLSQMKIDSWFLNLQPTSPCLELNFVYIFGLG